MTILIEKLLQKGKYCMHLLEKIFDLFTEKHQIGNYKQIS